MVKTITPSGQVGMELFRRIAARQEAGVAKIRNPRLTCVAENEKGDKVTSSLSGRVAT